VRDGVRRATTAEWLIARAFLARNRARESFPAWRDAPQVRVVNLDVFGEVVALLKTGTQFELDVLLVSHLNQEGFDPRKTPGDWLHDGGYDGRNSSTTAVGLGSGHSAHCTHG